MPQFGICSPQQFLDEIVLPQYREYCDDPMNVRKAVGAIIFAYHQYEWANECKFTADHFQSRYGKVPSVEKNLEVARKMANEMKHNLGKINSRVHQGDFAANGDWDIRDFNISRLVIVENDRREVSVPVLLEELIDFWTTQSQQGW